MSLIIVSVAHGASGLQAGTGGLEKQTIRQTVRNHRADIRACYEEVLEDRPDLEGMMEMVITISPDGTVKSVKPAGDALGSPVLMSCVSNDIREWVFPTPEIRQVTKIKYPFHFSAEE